MGSASLAIQGILPLFEYDDAHMALLGIVGDAWVALSFPIPTE